jgi:hypothetical protein
MDPFILPAISAASSIASGIFGSAAASESNKAARKAARAQNKYNKSVWRYQNREQNRQYDFQVESQEIAKRNYEADLQYREATQAQEWQYLMGIRDYEFNQANRAYNQSVSQATQQVSFNEMAQQMANMQQDRYMQEQMLGFAFDEQQTMLDYGIATAGLDLKRKQVKGEAGLALRTAQTQTKLSLQQSRLEQLKAQGTARAAGQAGRSARKMQQGISAEAGAQRAGAVQQLMDNQDSIVQQLMFAEAGIDLDYEKLNSQLLMDQAQFAAARDNLVASDAVIRKQFQLQELQANTAAINSIELLPEIAPPIPEPFALPRPEWTPIYKPEPLPEPQKYAASQQSTFSPLAQGVMQGISSFASIGAETGLFKASPGASGSSTFNLGLLNNYFR